VSALEAWDPYDVQHNGMIKEALVHSKLEGGALPRWPRPPRDAHA